MTGLDAPYHLEHRAGFELELLAPKGASRLTLANALAAEVGGRVRPVWHEAGERVPLPRLGDRFLHLSKAFEVTRADGALLCTLVDDVTIVAGLDPAAPAPEGWFRLLTDDPRLLRLLARTSDPGGPIETALDGVAALWGEQPERNGNIWRLDSAGATIALAAPMGGERERPCEIVTPPLSSGHQAAIEELLAPARRLGFTVPVEAAVHVHFDGAPFRDAPAVANLVRLFAHWREPLRELLGTNPACKRLAPLPAALVEAVDGEPDMAQLSEAAKSGGLTKYFDVNLTQLLRDRPLRDTVEIRILPGTLQADDAVGRAAIVEGLLDRCLDPQPFPRPPADSAAAVSVLAKLADVAVAR